MTRSDKWSHRTMLRDFLTERGVEIRELEAGDLPQREDVDQPRLFERIPRGERA